MCRFYHRLKDGEKPLFWAAVAFAVPFLLMWIGFACFGVFPFGSKQILVQDAWHQYYPFLVELRNKLIHGESLLYTWNNGLGTNFLALAAYYLASPLNLLLPLFPEENLQVFFTLMVTVKMGLASAFTAFALQKAFHRCDPAAVVFGCCYGLCAFFMGYYWNIMWLDSVALLPLVALGVVSLVRDGKFKLYVVALALSLICNFLMGLYVCIFTFFFFFVACFCSRIGWKTAFKRFVQIGCYTLIAIAMTAFLLLPVLMSLQNTYGISTAAPEWKRKESFVEVLGNFAAFGGPTDREGLPNLYTGLPCILLGALYVTSSKVPRRQRACALGLLMFLILSLNISVIEYIWNGFHTTNMLPYRFSFLISFVLAAMAFRVLPELLEELPLWKYVLMAGTAVVLLTLCWFTHGTAVTLANAGVMLAYVGVAFLLRERRQYMVLLLCMIFLGEMVANVIIGIYTVRVTTAVSFPANREEVTTLLDTIEEADDSFYRLESIPRQTLNDPSMLGYRGVSTFSSLANVNVTYVTEKLGIASYPAGNRYANNYIATPVANAFLGLKYFVVKNRAAEDNLYLTEIAAEGNTTAYRNEAALPLGFMAEQSMGEKLKGGNTYEIQNGLFSNATGQKDKVFQVLDSIRPDADNLKVTGSKLGSYTYTLLDKDQSGTMKYDCVIPRDGQLYLYVNCDEASSIEVLCGEQTIKFTMSARPDAFCVGNYQQGDVVSFRWDVGKDVKDKSQMKIYAAMLNEQVFAQGMKVLADETLQVTEFSSDYISGTIDVKKDGYFYTSVPYEQGWTLYVDGEEAEITPWQDAFVALDNLEAGTHTIEMKFVPGGFKLGAAISLGGLLLFILAIFLEKYFKNKNHSY